MNYQAEVLALTSVALVGALVALAVLARAIKITHN